MYTVRLSNDTLCIDCATFEAAITVARNALNAVPEADRDATTEEVISHLRLDMAMFGNDACWYFVEKDRKAFSDADYIEITLNTEEV
jgi:hypothetical protein